jgi:hypothetical protein
MKQKIDTGKLCDLIDEKKKAIEERQYEGACNRL